METMGYLIKTKRSNHEKNDWKVEIKCIQIV